MGAIFVGGWSGRFRLRFGRGVMSRWGARLLLTLVDAMRLIYTYPIALQTGQSIPRHQAPARYTATATQESSHHAQAFQGRPMIGDAKLGGYSRRCLVERGVKAMSGPRCHKEP